MDIYKGGYVEQKVNMIEYNQFKNIKKKYFNFLNFLTANLQIHTFTLKKSVTKNF